MPKEDGWIQSWFERRVKRRMQYVKKHAVYEKVPTIQCWNENCEEPQQVRLGGHKRGNVRMSRQQKISLGCEGIQHWTQARLVQCNVTSGGGEARHLGTSVKQPDRGQCSW